MPQPTKKRKKQSGLNQMRNLCYCSSRAGPNPLCQLHGSNFIGDSEEEEIERSGPSRISKSSSNRKRTGGMANEIPLKDVTLPSGNLPATIPGGEKTTLPSYNLVNHRMPLLTSTELPLDKDIPYALDNTYHRHKGHHYSIPTDSSNDHMLVWNIDPQDSYIRNELTKFEIPFYCDVGLTVAGTYSGGGTRSVNTSNEWEGDTPLNGNTHLFPELAFNLTRGWPIKIFDYIEISFENLESMFDNQTTKYWDEMTDFKIQTGLKFQNISQHSYDGQMRRHMFELDYLDEDGHWKSFNSLPGETEAHISETGGQIHPELNKHRNFKTKKQRIRSQNPISFTNDGILPEDAKKLRQLRLVMSFQMLDSIFRGRILMAGTLMKIRMHINKTYKFGMLEPTLWSNTFDPNTRAERIYKYVDPFREGIHTHVLETESNFTSNLAGAPDAASDPLDARRRTIDQAMWSLPLDHKMNFNRNECKLWLYSLDLNDTIAFTNYNWLTTSGIPYVSEEARRFSINIPTGNTTFEKTIFQGLNCYDFVVFWIRQEETADTKKGRYQNYTGDQNVDNPRKTQYSRFANNLIAPNTSHKQRNIVKKLRINSYYKTSNHTEQALWTSENQDMLQCGIFNADFLAGHDQQWWLPMMEEWFSRNDRNLDTFYSRTSSEPLKQYDESGQMFGFCLAPGARIEPKTLFTQITGSLDLVFEFEPHMWDDYPRWGDNSIRKPPIYHLDVYTLKKKILVGYAAGSGREYKWIDPNDPLEKRMGIVTLPGQE